jgi:hypothetical protein
MIWYSDIDLGDYQPLTLLRQVMSKAEGTGDDAKKLAQRCKALEAQLRQTITKKEHHEIVLEFEDKMTAMEKTISNQGKKLTEQEKEIAQTKTELQRSIALNKQIGEVGGQVAVLSRTNDAQGKALDSLVAKLAQGTVPTSVHHQSLSKINDLEERIGDMVSRSEYAALQRRYDEASRQVSSMVPASEYEALKERIQELEDAASTMVPREQLDSSEAAVKDLQARLAEHVPQSTYDDLVSKVVQLAEEVTGGQPFAEEAEPTPQQSEPTEPEHPSPAEVGPGGQQDIPAGPAPIQAEVEVVAATVEGPVEVTEEQSDSPPEIREIGTKLAEIKTEEIVEAEPAEVAPAEESPEQAPPSNETEDEEDSLLVPAVASESVESGERAAPDS